MGLFQDLFKSSDQQASGQWVNGKFVKSSSKSDFGGPLPSAYTFEVAGTNFRMDNIIRLATPMKKWSMTNEQILQKYPGKRIYRYYFVNNPVQLVPEPTNPHDPNAIMVLINNIHVGYIPSQDISTVSQYLKTGPVTLDANISGGEYKIVYEDGQSASFSDPISIRLTISR